VWDTIAVRYPRSGLLRNSDVSGPSQQVQRPALSAFTGVLAALRTPGRRRIHPAHWAA
jgi:hypothetical protein